MLTVDLYPYQSPALDLFLSRGNLLIDMDMGLGKTTTSLACAEQLLGDGRIRTCVIICPAGLIMQWAASIASVTDVETKLVSHEGRTFAIPTEDWCLIIDGSPKRREKLLDQAFEKRPNYVIASHDIAAASWRRFRELGDLTIIDEATCLKNPKAQRARGLHKIVTDYRIALTGTPIENRLEEAFTIMKWVDPDLFGPWPVFEKRHIIRNGRGWIIGYKNLSWFHQELSKASYRKRATDPDVAPFMPSVRHVRWDVRLDAATMAVYRSIMEDLEREYGRVDEDELPVGRAMSIHQAALMLLDHPGLLHDSAEEYLRGTGGSEYAAELVASGRLNGLTATPKLDVLVERLQPYLSQDGCKIIIVSRYVGMLTRIADRLKGVGHVIYHGGMSRAAQQSAVHAFQTDPGIRVLIMSHAGAYGLDLPQAQLIVNYDIARSAGQARQINARHVRASSSFSSVGVADLVTLDTVEDRAYRRLGLKNRIVDAGVDGIGIDWTDRLIVAGDTLREHVLSAIGGLSIKS